ncbi:hypothetical protein [Rhodobacteraceae bacterium DSL-40]|uniref:hypothetical protein n=1 Tax=Amaricoccus sp. B4 TaxID=3368557 RepID=UPI000DACEB0D
MIRALLIALALTAAAGTARAETDPPPAAPESDGTCAAFDTPDPAAAATQGAADRSLIQAGLRVYFGADGGFLSDGIIGPVTVSFLRKLCETMPLAAGTDPVGGTLDVAREFGALSSASPGWPARLGDPALLESTAAGPEFNRAAVRLAGGPAMAAGVFGGLREAEGCDGLADHDFSGARVSPADLQAGLAALASADPGLAPLPQPLAEPGIGPETRGVLAQVCALYPLKGGPDALASAMARYGALETAVPNAVGLLGAPGFALWLGEDRVARLGRLVATAPAVVRLLGEFNGSATPPSAEGLPPVCAAPSDEERPTYYALTARDMEALAARSGIQAALAPVTAERFRSRTELAAAVGTALGLDPKECTARLVETIIDRNEAASLVYDLDPEALKRLALRPELAGTLAAVSGLGGLESETRPALETAVEAAIRTAVGASEQEVAGAAAEAAAAAAEDVSPAPDMAAAGFEGPEALEAPQEFAITDSSLLVIEAEVTEKAFFDAINATPYRPVQSRDMVRADMLLALRPVVQQRTAAATASQLETVMTTLRTRWRLGDAVVAALAARTEFAAISPELDDAARFVAQISYPEGRLFDRAIETLPVTPDPAAEAVFAELARKQVDDPYARRHIAPIASDCGCNVTRESNALVYAFYPFWMFPAEAEPPVPEVDFDIVSRIAFDGLELDGTGAVHYAAQWSDAAATFVTSAHRHEVEADLSIRLRGWRGWNDDAIRTGVDAIAGLLAPAAADTLLHSPGLFGGLDKMLSRKPDGVTLIVEGYDGSPASPPPTTLLSFVRALADRLEASGQSINLAFDIPLVASPNQTAPLFRDLRGLIVNTEDPEARPVDHLLVFLERPTSQAKKLLRARIEGSFTGEERIQVLRSVIPVVPPGANAALDHAPPSAAPASGTEDETSISNSYGQFDDDLVYFQDNFDGVGFWPAPVAGAVLPDGSPDRLAEIVAARYYTWAPALVPRSYVPMARSASEGVCRVVCPNRIPFYLLTLATAGIAVGLGVLTFYSGRVKSLCDRLLLVPVLALVVLGLLGLIAACDVDSRVWSLGAMAALVALLGASIIFQWYGRRLDGPMP